MFADRLLHCVPDSVLHAGLYSGAGAFADCADLFGAWAWAAFGGWLFLMFKAYNREKFVIPVIGPLAEKQA